MVILNFLLNYLLRPQAQASFLVGRVLGCFFLLLAAGIGIYFIFQALVPEIGYFESGALLCAFLAGIGFLFLFLNRKKETRPIDDVLGETQEIYKRIEMGIKHLELDKMVRRNAPKILLGAFVAGLVLSQFRDVKKLAFLKEKLPRLKDFSKWDSWLK